MIKKALIFDLDNTIYPVASIGDHLFARLFKLIEEDGRYHGDFQAVKNAIQRKPFQVVAAEFEFDRELLTQGVALLADLEHTGEVIPFDDFPLIHSIDCLKFVVTSGFSKLQWSKIKRLHLDRDFDACFVVDPVKSNQTKKDVFIEILETYQLKPEEALVIGDDIHSEVKAGIDLGMDTVLYDYTGKRDHTGSYQGDVVSNYRDLMNLLTRRYFS